MSIRKCILFGIYILALLACNPKVEVFAPERELYAVYGVLNPNASEQMVTVTKVFQTEDDAYHFAASNDLTARGLTVTLRSDSLTLTGVLIDVPDSMAGMFPMTTGVYRFETVGPSALRPGDRYDLAIQKSDDPEFLIQAWTIIPYAPTLLQPGAPIFSEIHQTYTLPTLEFSKDWTAEFKTGGASGFEIRVFVRYWINGVPHVTHWGPTAIFQSEHRCHSNAFAHEMCHQVPKSTVPNSLHSIFEDYHPDTVEVYDTLRVAHTLDSLDTNVWVEVTGVDSFLTKYLSSNDPFGFGVNLLLDKQAFSNISGGNTGVFGSYNTSSRFVFMDECSRWIAGLRTPRPAGCGQ